MRIDVLTLFPEMFAPVLCGSVIGRAAQKGLADFRFINIRDFSRDKHKKTDDYPYGGGCGMVMTARPIYDAWRAAALPQEADGTEKTARTIYMSPQGAALTQKKALELSRERHLIILCGHYEGVDERAIELIGAEEISIGDYVLTGGEIPAMALIDSVVRLIPGALSEEAAYRDESHYNGLLEYPQYTRPERFMGKGVPPVLLSGNHSDIASWRGARSVELTKRKRPDLFTACLRRLDISGSANMRDLGGYAAKGGAATRWRTFIRSDWLRDITGNGISDLLGMGLTTVIDLRSADEVARYPNAIAPADGVECRNVPLLSEAAIDKSIGEAPFKDLYILFAEKGKKKIGKVFTIMAGSPGACLFHCHAGKDRTGIIAALLLLLAGVSETDAVADYQVSGTYYKDRLNVYTDDDAYDSKPDTILHFINHINKKYGGAEAYLREAGVTAGETALILDKFLGYTP